MRISHSCPGLPQPTVGRGKTKAKEGLATACVTQQSGLAGLDVVLCARWRPGQGGGRCPAELPGLGLCLSSTEWGQAGRAAPFPSQLLGGLGCGCWEGGCWVQASGEMGRMWPALRSRPLLLPPEVASSPTQPTALHSVLCAARRPPPSHPMTQAPLALGHHSRLAGGSAGCAEARSEREGRWPERIQRCC